MADWISGKDITGAALGALLPPIVAWVASLIPAVRAWFLQQEHPWRLVVGISLLCAISTSLLVTAVPSVLGRSPKIKIEALENKTGDPSYLGPKADDKFCVFSYIHKDRINSGSTTLHVVGDHWVITNSAEFLDTAATCYKVTLEK